jgi:hypothetical protein
MSIPQLFLCILICVVTNLGAQQGNYKFNNFGNRSILLSGNVTGSVEDIALAYYNPARLTEVADTRFAFNAKAYQLSSLKLSNLLGEESNQSSTNFNGVPSMAGGTFKLLGTRFAYSFLSRTRNNIGINYTSDLLSKDILNDFPGNEQYKVKLDLNTMVKDEWIGLTWATKVTKQFSLGISGFSSIYRYQGRSVLNYTVLSEAGNVAYFQNDTSFRQDSYGLVLKVGANYHFTKFNIGLNINIPYIEVYDEGRFNFNKTIAGIDSDTDRFIDYKFNDLKASRKEPFGISAGAGVPVGMSKLHLNVDFVNSLNNYSRIDLPTIDTGDGEISTIQFDEKRKMIFNFGMGAEIFIHDQLKAYGSFSTDFNSFESNSNVFDLTAEGDKSINIGANFMHGSVGIDWKLSWASIILGTTYTSGSSEFLSPLRPTEPDINDTNTELTQIDYVRWQFVVGLEFPFIDNKVKGMLDKDK